MGMCYGKESWAEVRWGFLEERKLSKSRASVQCQGSWERVRAWGQERDWKLEFRDPGIRFFASGILSVQKAELF